MSTFIYRCRARTDISADNTSPELCTHPGDVIAVREDGHLWSKADREHPHWQIVEAPEVSVEDLIDMQASASLRPRPSSVAMGINVAPSLPLFGRAKRFDIEVLEQLLSPATNDQPRYLLPGKREALLAAKIVREMPQTVEVG